VASARTADGLLPSDVGLQLRLTLAVDLGWESRVRFVDGAAPAAWTGSEADDLLPQDRPPIEIALSEAAADVLHVEVGDVIGFMPADTLVAGIYEPIDPADPYWIHESGLVDASIEPVTGQLPIARTSAYIAPASAAGLQEALIFGRLQAWIPVDTSGFDYSDAAELQTQVRQVAAAQVSLNDFGNLSFRSGLPEVIDRAIGKVTAASSLLALSVSGLLGVLLAVFALGVQSVVTRRRPALALASARGAGELQLRGAMVLEGLLLSLPGSAVAVAAAALLIPDRVGIEAWVLPAAVALAPPVLFATMTSGRDLRAPRSDLRFRARSQSRWIAEVAVVALAALSLFLLGRRGLVESSDAVGIDPLLAATPLLLAAAVCIGVLRLYPLPLLGVQRGLRRRRGAAGVLGAARAIRDPSLGFPAALALVVGITIVVFSSVMSTTLRSGLEQAAQDEVGADIQVKAQALGPAVVAAVEGIDGVDSAVAIAVQNGVPLEIGPDQTEVFLVLADTVTLHAARPDIPRLDTEVDGRIPLLISTDWADRIEDGDLTLAGRPAIEVGVQPPDALPGASRHWALIDSSFAGGLVLDGALTEPLRMIVRLDDGVGSGAVAPAVLETVTGLQPEQYRGLVTVTDIDTELASARAAPTVSGLETALLIAAIVSLLLTMLAVVLGSVAAATSRNRTVGVLRILGMSARQLRVLAAWELAPVAITAVVIGTALGLALPWIVTGVLDLRPFVGGRFPPTPAIDPVWVGAAVAGFVVVVVIAGLIAAALGRRFAPAGTLKMGEG
jgi:putative ABC transport system permease protein